MQIAELLATTGVALIGLYLAHSFTRQQRLRIAEQRIEAYRKLWALMIVARSTRVKPPENAGPLSRSEAAELYNNMTRWYFGSGNGMMLTETSREMYLLAKRRLGEYAVGADGETGPSGTDGELRIRELSLLRMQLKLDLDTYGVFYFDQLGKDDRSFLEACGIDHPDRWGRPWYWPVARKPRPRT